MANKKDDNEDDFLEAEELQEHLANLRSIATVQTLAELVETLTEAIESMQESDSKKVFYDKTLGKNLTASIDKVASSLKGITQPIDLSALTKSSDAFIKAQEKSNKAFTLLIADIREQNKELIKSLQSIKIEAPENNDTLVKEALKVINRSNDLISKGMSQIDYTKSLEKIADRPTEWVFEVWRSKSGLIENVIAKAKTKK